MQATTDVKLGKDFMIMRKASLILGLLTLVVGLQQCKKSKTIDNGVDFFPPVQVNTQLNLNLPQYIPLSFPQGYVYLPEGNKGIVVFNKPSGGYVAFDRTCSHNPTDACAQVTVDSNFVGYRCGKYESGFQACCTSVFDLQSGVVINGPAVRPLRAYFTSYDATNNILFISSNPF